ncbi:MAG: translation initiation factor-like protein [Ramlibacter sp.]|nr:translation initiation factor-like protein [Ramlibacter sp.]MCE3273201.1 translation initiation factor-like protein [Ramlibacter sp.]
MQSEFPLVRALAACGAAAVLGACAVPAPAPPPPAPAPAPASEPMRVMVLPAPPQAAAAPPAATAPAVPPARVHPVETAVSYADRVRALAPAEVAQEVQRLGDSSYTPARAIQLALALGQARTPASATRAQALLQRLLADTSEDARGLHGFARLLLAQMAEQRRVEEQAERLAQQLREAQRRIDQLNERLEAVRAIERSLPGPAQRPPARP